MKEFITGIAMLLLMCVFILQFTTNQILHNKMVMAESDINVYVEQIKQDGCASSAAAEDLKAKLSSDLKVDPGDIEIDVDDGIKNRGELIAYSVTYPLEGVIGAGGFFGISTEDNIVRRTRDGYCASEHIEEDTFEDAL